MNDDQDLDLNGKLLVAMPGMGDPRFDTSVIYICAHSDEGAMGLIINKPAPEIDLGDLLGQLKIVQGPACRDIRLRFGGPVEHGRGFVLHSTDYMSENATQSVNDRFGMTATLDILEDMAKGTGPAEALLMLGYSGWGPGQLEDEIARNGWLTCDASPELVFGRDPSLCWAQALGSLGIDPLLLSATAGRA